MLRLLMFMPFFSIFLFALPLLAYAADDVTKSEKVQEECVPGIASNHVESRDSPLPQEAKKCSEKSSQKKKEKSSTKKEADYGALAANPAAVNLFNGTGKLGQFLGIAPETGVQFGGIWIGNTAFILGGQNAGDATYNNLAIVDLQVDLQKFAEIDGASFAATFLQFDGGKTNSRGTRSQGLIRQPFFRADVRPEFRGSDRWASGW